MIVSKLVIVNTCQNCGHFWNSSPSDGFATSCPKCSDSFFGWKLKYDNIPKACVHCSNHPSNGGSGVCHCTLGNTTTVNC